MSSLNYPQNKENSNYDKKGQIREKRRNRLDRALKCTSVIDGKGNAVDESNPDDVAHYAKDTKTREFFGRTRVACDFCNDCWRKNRFCFKKGNPSRNRHQRERPINAEIREELQELQEL